MARAALADARATSAWMEQERAAEQERAPPRPRSASAEPASSAASSARSAAAARRAAVAADHPPDACRYPNKRCFNKRALKNNGQLHKFCAAHRDSANQYQRRLEQRLKQKRIQSRLRSLQAQREQAAAMAAAAAAASATGTGSQALVAHAAPRVAAPVASGTQNVLAAHYAANQPGMLRSRSVGSNPLDVVQPCDAPPPSLPVALAPAATGFVPEFEPFRQPVSLEDEDIECLYDLFLES